MDSPVCSNTFASQDQLPSQTTDAGSPNSVQTSEYEDAQSGITATTSFSTTDASYLTKYDVFDKVIFNVQYLHLI